MDGLNLEPVPRGPICRADYSTPNQIRDPARGVQAEPQALFTRRKHVQIARDYIRCATSVVTGLIREMRMSLANPLWGAPRICGELLKLGIDFRSVAL
jgi:hypothetical protein